MSKRQTNIEVGEAVRKARLAAGITQKELAARLGLNQSNMSRLEQGAIDWTIDIARRTATAIGVRRDAFMQDVHADSVSPAA